MSYLNAVGIKSERLSVAKRHYDDFALVVHDERLNGPDVDLLKQELLQLRIMNNDKVDHPRKGSKDLADAVAGAIFNAIAHTPRDLSTEIEVHNYESIMEFTENKIEVPPNVIKPPTRENMPTELSTWLQSIDFV
jgi:hypothetical protein